MICLQNFLLLIFCLKTIHLRKYYLQMYDCKFPFFSRVKFKICSRHFHKFNFVEKSTWLDSCTKEDPPANVDIRWLNLINQPMDSYCSQISCFTSDPIKPFTIVKCCVSELRLWDTWPPILPKHIKQFKGAFHMLMEEMVTLVVCLLYSRSIGLFSSHGPSLNLVLRKYTLHSWCPSPLLSINGHQPTTLEICQNAREIRVLPCNGLEKVTVTNQAHKAVLFWEFKSLENYTIKLSAKRKNDWSE